MNHSLYLDLFDDGLYPVEAVNDLEASGPVNTLRLQVLLAILFRRPLLVPEQWAISSATFMKVAYEVLHHWTPVLESRVSRTDTAQRLIPFPFKVLFFRTREEKSGFRVYSQAFVERATKGHRIQVTPRLANELDAELREELRAAFLSLPENPAQEAIDAKLRSALFRTLGDEQAAVWISSLARHLSIDDGERYGFFDGQTYRQELSRQVNVVFDHVQRSPLLQDSGEQRIEDFRAFIGEARARRMNFSDLTQLWTIARTYDKPSAVLIAAAGRYVLHRSMASTLGVQFAASMPALYFAEAPDSYDALAERFFLELRDRELESDKAPQTPDIDTWIRDVRVRTDQPAWPDVWREVFAFSISPEWGRSKRRLAEGLPALPQDRRHQHEAWDEIVDLLGNLPVFEVCRSSSDERYLTVRISPASSATLDPSAVPGEVTQQLSDLAASAGLGDLTPSGDYAAAPHGTRRARELKRPR